MDASTASSKRDSAGCYRAIGARWTWCCVTRRSRKCRAWPGFLSAESGAIRIQVDPAKLAASGLTLEEIRTTIVNATTNTAKGTLNTSKTAFTIAANDQIKARLPRLIANIPPAMEIATMFDRTVTIRATVHDVEFTLLLTIGLVVIVILLFLRNFWATLIPSITIPLALLGSFAAMYLLNFSLNNISLMALINRHRLRGR